METIQNEIRNITNNLLFHSTNNNSFINKPHYFILQNKTAEEIEEYSTLILNIIGIIFNLICIFVFIKLKMRKLSQKGHELITYINISTLINNISHIIKFYPLQNIYNNLNDNNDNEVSISCLIQGSLMFYSETSQILTSTIFTFSIFMFCKLKNIEFYKMERGLYIFLGFIFPFLLVLMFIYLKLFGKNEHYCWIGKENEITQKIFSICLIIILLINIILITLCCCYNRKKENNNSDISREVLISIRSQINKMLIFPILFIFCWILPVIDYFNDYNLILDVLCISYPCILGIGISIISFYIFYSSGITCEILCCEKKNIDEDFDDEFKNKLYNRKNTSTNSITIKA
jgi:hypothetical protein